MKALNRIYRNNASSFPLTDRLYGLAGQKIELHDRPGRQEARNIICASYLKYFVQVLSRDKKKDFNVVNLFCVHGVSSASLIEVSPYHCRLHPAGTEKSKHSSLHKSGPERWSAE